MVWDEADLLPISGLQHLAFCERQWGLIHLEQVWLESVLTAEGRVLHERVHEADSQLRGDVLTARGVRLRSLRLGLTGVADVVEFHRVAMPVGCEEADAGTAGPGVDLDPSTTVTLPRRRGRWRPMPVEFKRGRPKRGDFDRVQLCAQALCLEEMLEVRIDEGAIFYGEPRRRQSVPFDPALREETGRLAAHMHELMAVGRTPDGVYEKKCRSCSLFELCRPEKIRPGHSAAGYLKRELNSVETEEE